MGPDTEFPTSLLPDVPMPRRPGRSAAPALAPPAASSETARPAPARFPHPKILLIDLPPEAAATLSGAGYQVAVGTLGQPFKVPVSDDFIQIAATGVLPNFAEQEVVVLQQRAPEAAQDIPAGLPIDTGELGVWGKRTTGTIDPRPYVASMMSGLAARIHDHGGVFVIFCEPRRRPYLFSVQGGGSLRRPVINQELQWTVWDLLPMLGAVRDKPDHGEEVTVEDFNAFKTLRPHLAGATFSCTMTVAGPAGRRWVRLASNKYVEDVAGVIFPENMEDGGWTFLLPQVEDPGACVECLLNDVLPYFAPKLFPDSDKTGWLQSEAYELPEVTQLRAEIAVVREDAAAREEELNAEIAARRAEDGWMHTLLTGTADELVVAVATALEHLGLKQVKKVDDEEEARQTGRYREDVQVWGESPVMLIEVKGIVNLPKEANALQVTKYLVPRMKEWERVDVRGLAIINQQRGLPALDRDNVNTFQEDVVANSEHHEFGLLTTIDLFRLVRNKRRWGWANTDVAPLMYQNGRIHPIPLHYEHVGTVDNFFERPGVVAIQVTGSGFAVGDRLAFILPIDYMEEVAESIHLDDAAVARAEPGTHIGVKTGLSKAQARNGVAVYRVKV
jgi:hypothetical protein